MISNDDLDELSGLDPEHMFCIFERRQRQKLEEAIQSSWQNEPPIFNDYDYMMAVLAAAKEFEIDELSDYDLPYAAANDWQEKCQNFRANATLVSHRFYLRYGISSKTVALDTATKDKISHWLTKMRELVQKAEVSFEKKDRLFALINELQAEVDRDRTPVHAVGELFVTLCTYLKTGAKELQPVADLVRHVCVSIGIAKEKEETQRKLPKRKDPKRIEAPKKNNPFDKDLDDEIPF